MSKEYRNLKVKGETFYISHKEPQEGTVKVELQDGRVFHHELVKSLQGRFGKVRFEEGKFGDVVRFTIEDDNYYNVVDFNLKTQRGSLDPFAKSFIQYLSNIPLDQDVVVFINTRSKNAKGFAYKNFIFGVAEDDATFVKLDWAITSSDIPPVEKVTNALGKTTFNSTVQDNFLIEKLAEYLGINKSEEKAPSQSNQPSQPTQGKVDKATKADKVTKPPDIVPEDEDDLPF